jgi:hypothetical protein
MKRGKILIVGVGFYGGFAHAEVAMLTHRHVMENTELVVVDIQREEDLVKQLILRKQKELELNVLNPLILLNNLEDNSLPFDTNFLPTNTTPAKKNAICANHCIAGKNKHCIQPRAPASQALFFLHFY